MPTDNPTYPKKSARSYGLGMIVCGFTLFLVWLFHDLVLHDQPQDTGVAIGMILAGLGYRFGLPGFRQSP